MCSKWVHVDVSVVWPYLTARRESTVNKLLISSRFYETSSTARSSSHDSEQRGYRNKMHDLSPVRGEIKHYTVFNYMQQHYYRSVVEVELLELVNSKWK